MKREGDAERDTERERVDMINVLKESHSYSRSDGANYLYTRSWTYFKTSPCIRRAWKACLKHSQSQSVCR